MICFDDNYCIHISVIKRPDVIDDLICFCNSIKHSVLLLQKIAEKFLFPFITNIKPSSKLL